MGCTYAVVLSGFALVRTIALIAAPPDVWASSESEPIVEPLFPLFSFLRILYRRVNGEA